MRTTPLQLAVCVLALGPLATGPGLAQSGTDQPGTMPPGIMQHGTDHQGAMQPGMTGQSSGATMQVDTPTFVRMASSANQFEILSSRLAVDQAQDQAVKDFANRMIDEHTTAGSRMAEVTKTAGIQSADSAGEESLESRHKEMLDTLSRNEGSFDEAYVRAQIQAHQEAVSLFSAYAETGDEPQLKTLAQELLPRLQQHLAAVQELPGAPLDAQTPTGSTSGGMTLEPGMMDQPSTGTGTSGGMQGSGSATGGGAGGSSAQ